MVGGYYIYPNFNINACVDTRVRQVTYIYSHVIDRIKLYSSWESKYNSYEELRYRVYISIT
jgi:hypothetical protein